MPVEPPQAELPIDPAPGADVTAPTDGSSEEAKVAVAPKAKPRTRRRTKAANGPKAARGAKVAEDATPEDETSKSADDTETKPVSA